MFGYFTEKLKKQFDYFDLGNGNARVFVYKYLEDTQMADGTVVHKYETNEFICEASEEIRKKIEANPEKYLYFTTVQPTLEQRVSAAEATLLDLLGGIDE